MKVLYLTSYGGRNGGGLFTTMTSILPLLKNEGIEVELMCYHENNAQELKDYYPNIPITQYKISNLPILKQFGYSSELLKKIEQVHPDIIHIQGMWLYYSYAAYKYSKKHPECKIILQPHGMLDEWAIKNSRLKKKAITLLFEKKNLESADCIHALCKREFDSIRNFGVSSPIVILPNGITISSTTTPHKRRKKTLLFISRIHPKKGLTELIDALGLIKESCPQFFNLWEIRIAGWNQHNYLSELEAKINQYSISEYITFLGPVFGKAKEQELTNADAFILPSHSEGLPMSILEAWSFSLPVIMTDFCNLPEGFDASAAIRIEPNKESIYNVLKYLTSLSTNELVNIGKNGKGLVEEKFQWTKIAIDTITLYNYLLGKSQKPLYYYEN